MQYKAITIAGMTFQFTRIPWIGLDWKIGWGDDQLYQALRLLGLVWNYVYYLLAAPGVRMPATVVVVGRSCPYWPKANVVHKSRPIKKNKGSYHL